MKIAADRMRLLKRFEDVLKYSFRDIGLLNTALTHSSFANERNLSVHSHNERLEFLGDAVLEMVTSEFLYQQPQGFSEGELTKLRASMVRGQALASYACKMGMGEYILLGRGERAAGGQNRPSLLANAFEAVIGAVYNDGGYPPARELVLRFVQDEMIRAVEKNHSYDSKTALQEEVQSESGRSVEYRLLREMGPAHDKTFYVQVFINGNAYGVGVGKSKKEAEQNAARKALEKLVT